MRIDHVRRTELGEQQPQTVRDVLRNSSARASIRVSRRSSAIIAPESNTITVTGGHRR